MNFSHFHEYPSFPSPLTTILSPTCMPFLLSVAIGYNCGFLPKHGGGLCFEPRSGHLLSAIPLNYPQQLNANSPAGMGGYLCASPTR